MASSANQSGSKMGGVKQFFMKALIGNHNDSKPPAASNSQASKTPATSLQTIFVRYGDAGSSLEKSFSNIPPNSGYPRWITFERGGSLNDMLKHFSSCLAPEIQYGKKIPNLIRLIFVIRVDLDRNCYIEDVTLVKLLLPAVKGVEAVNLALFYDASDPVPVSITTSRNESISDFPLDANTVVNEPSSAGEVQMDEKRMQVIRLLLGTKLRLSPVHFKPDQTDLWLGVYDRAVVNNLFSVRSISVNISGVRERLLNQAYEVESMRLMMGSQAVVDDECENLVSTDTSNHSQQHQQQHQQQQQQQQQHKSSFLQYDPESHGNGYGH